VFTLGKFNAHSQINTFCKGYIKKKQDRIAEIEDLDMEQVEKNSYIFGTSCGQIGMIQTIPPEIFYYLNFLEYVMNQEISSSGDFENQNFRMNDPTNDPYEKLELLDQHKTSKRFIDGDFIASFTSLPEKKQLKILDKVNTYQIPENMMNKEVTIDWIQNIVKSLNLS
jgi:hypothetical protein